MRTHNAALAVGSIVSPNHRMGDAQASGVRVEGLLVSVRIHQRKDSRGDRDGGGRDGGGMNRGGRDCSAGYCFGLWGGWNI